MDTKTSQNVGGISRIKDSKISHKAGMTYIATLITGGGAGLAEGLVCHPLDTIKVRMQLVRGLQEGSRIGILKTGYHIVKSESFPALYRGLIPVLFGIVPKMAVRFTSFEEYKSLLLDSKSGGLSDRRLLLAALAAGITEAVIIVTPMDVVKIRLQAEKLSATSKNSSQSRILAVLLTLRREGFASLYSGMGLTALRQGTNQAANLFTYTKLTKLLRDLQPEYRDTSLPIYQVTLTGLLAGSMGPLFNAPIDTLKTCVQRGPRLPGQSKVNHLLTIVSNIWQKDGVRGLYKGVLPRIMRVGLGQAVTFPVYELLRKKLGS